MRGACLGPSHSDSGGADVPSRTLRGDVRLTFTVGWDEARRPMLLSGDVLADGCRNIEDAGVVQLEATAAIDVVSTVGCLRVRFIERAGGRIAARERRVVVLITLARPEFQSFVEHGCIE